MNVYYFTPVTSVLVAPMCVFIIIGAPTAAIIRTTGVIILLYVSNRMYVV